MQTDQMLQSQSSPRPGVLAAAALAVVWVALSLQTGLNHHLFPLVIAGIPAGLAGLFGGPPLRATSAAIATIAGFGIVWATWLVFVALDETPTATFFSGQPGGAFGEALLLSLVGALGAYAWNRSR